MFSSLFSKILVPYDGSKFSKKALSKAMEVARNVDSEIFFFSVVNFSHISPPGGLHGLTLSRSEKDKVKRWQEETIRNTERMLKSEVEKCKSKGLTASYDIGRGNVSQEILNFAQKKKATVIIIGSQGLSGLNKLKALGSVSRKVSELAHCPVLIVR